MPICNRFLAIAAVSALFAAPVFADGTPGKQVNRGPAPLQAHAMAPPAPGCVLVEGNTMWSCPAPQAQFTRAPQTRLAGPPTVTRTVRRSAPTTTTRRVTRSRPVTTRRVAATQQVTLDLASFSGGVGNGVDGGFYGGGGAIFFGGGQRYSGVLQHGASAFTFQRRGGGGKKRGGKKYGSHGGGGCGC